MTKYLFLIIITLAISITAISQQQPENPGFENWESVPVAGEEPVEWSSLKTSDGGTLINAFAPVVWAKSTDAHTGSYSVKLTNIYVAIASTVATGTVTNGRIHAEISGTGWAFSDSIPANTQWYTSFNQKPDSVVVWAKFFPQGNDVAAVKALLHTGYAQIPQADMSTWVSLAQIDIPDEVSTWTRFSAPFVYFSEDTPEKILFVLSGGGEASVENTVTYFDDLELIYNPLSLDLKVMLEGPYAGSNQMSTDLNPDHIPLAQPFNTAPWNYSGGEIVLPLPSPDIVDWVLVEIRDATTAANATSATTIARQAAFVLKDGSIVGLDGTSRLSFDNMFNEGLFVVIWHRNHLGIMSANPLVKTDGYYAYDFTDDAAKTYGGIDAVKQLETFGVGAWGMIGGDGDANGTVNSIDKTSFWSILSGKGGYLSGDYNLDGEINNQDKNDIWVENIDKNTHVPN